MVEHKYNCEIKYILLPLCFKDSFNRDQLRFVYLKRQQIVSQNKAIK